MKLLNFKVGPIETNCYVVINNWTNECLIIDPGAEENTIINGIEENNLKPQAILLTHTHFDHIGAVNALVNKYDIPYYFSEKEKEHIFKQKNNLNAFGYDSNISTNYKFIEPGINNFCNFKIKVFETPGHTIGSLCFYIEANKIIFSGDTLFYRTIGRTDLSTGNHEQIIDSIENILFKLPHDVLVYPGHENETTIGDEIEHNPLV